MKKNYLVGYDISNEKRLTKIGKIMQGFGNRLQYSFFHCCLSERQLQRMKERLKQTMDEKDDQVIILPVTEKQLHDIEFLGCKTDLSSVGIIIV